MNLFRPLDAQLIIRFGLLPEGRFVKSLLNGIGTGTSEVKGLPYCNDFIKS